MKRILAAFLLLLLTSPAYAWTDAKFNFRGSAAGPAPGVTDGAGETAVIDASGVAAGTQGEQYPTGTAPAVVYGWDNNTTATRDRSATPGAKFAGIHRNELANVAVFQVDLPNAGTYAVRLAIGDYNQAWATLKAEVYDSGSLLLTVSGSTANGDEFLDANYNSNATVRSSANWGANNEAVNLTFATTTFYLKIGNGLAIDTGAVAHLEISAVASGAETFGFYKRRVR